MVVSKKYDTLRIGFGSTILFFCFFVLLFFLLPSFVRSLRRFFAKVSFIIFGTRHNMKHRNICDMQESMNFYWPRMMLSRMPSQPTQEALCCCYFYSPLRPHAWGCAEFAIPLAFLLFVLFLLGRCGRFLPFRAFILIGWQSIPPQQKNKNNNHHEGVWEVEKNTRRCKDHAS